MVENSKVCQGRIGLAETGLVEAVAAWCLTTQGTQPLRTALQSIAEALDAEAALISRRNGRGAATSAVIPVERRRVPERLALSRSYADCVLGDYIDRPKVGTIWYSSHSEDNGDPALAIFQRRRNVSETVVIVLASNDRTCDFLELFLRDRASSFQMAGLNALASVLCRTWAARAPGLFAEALLERQQSRRGAGADHPILSPENPSGLSRSEFRVCMLLSHGLSTQRIQDDLSISNSTLRSHLRNIYAKTDVSSQAELMFRLLARPMAQAAGRLAAS